MKNNKKIKAFLLKLLTRKKRSNFPVSSIKKVLVFRYDRIGDMVVTTPLFRELKKCYPDIEISVLASKANQDIIKHSPYISAIFTNFKNNFIQDLPTLVKLRRMKFDISIELDHSVITHAIIRHRIIKPKQIISIYKAGRYGVLGNEIQLYDFYTNEDQKNHFVKIWLDTLIFFGIKTNSTKYDIFLSNEEREKASLFLLEFNDKVKIGINVEAFSLNKNIKIFDLKKICQGLYKFNNDIRIFLMSAPKNRKNLFKLIDEMNLDFVSLSFETKTVLEAAALIEKLDLVISPDTSIVHIASAFNIPVVSIHENNHESYRLWAPKSDLSDTIFSISKVGLNDYNIDQVISSANEIIQTLELKI